MKIKAQVFSGIITITIFCGLLRAQITGVTAGTDLTGGGTSGNVTLNLDTTKVPRLAAANAFSGNQSVKGNVSASGTVAGSAFMIGANLFDYGSYGNGNAFLGFGGNTSNTGAFNTATRYGSLVSLTTGSSNTAGGADALFANTTGENNTAYGESAMYSNNTGEENTAVGYAALAANQAGIGNTAAGTAAMGSNTTGTYNAALGYLALSSNLAGIGNTGWARRAVTGMQTAPTTRLWGIARPIPVSRSTMPLRSGPTRVSERATRSSWEVAEPKR